MTETRVAWDTALAASQQRQRSQGGDSGDMAMGREVGGYRAHEAEGQWGHRYWLVLGPDGRVMAQVDSGDTAEMDARRVVAALELVETSAVLAEHLTESAAEDSECLLCGHSNPHHDGECPVPAFLAAVERAEEL